MKKFFVSFAVVFFLPVAVFASYMPGIYTAKLNLNIRALPAMNGQLIGHFDQGNAVQVLQNLGSWCRVSSKYFHSYVYCGLLSPNGSNATVQGQYVLNFSNNGVATQLLQNTENWLVNNNVGVNYINNSFFQARSLAFSWAQNPQITDFYFQWPLLTESKCSITFRSSAKPLTAFYAQCFDDSGKVSTSQTAVNNSQQGYDVPKLLFKNYVLQLLADKSVISDMDSYFGSTMSLKGLFRLYKDANGVQLWEGKFIDETSGRFEVVSADASKVNAMFNVQKGLF